MTERGLALLAGDARPLVMRGAHTLSRGDIRQRADALHLRFSELGATRVAIHSDDSALILAAIDAADRAGIDLFIAHTTLGPEQIETIWAEQAVQLVLTDVGEQKRLTAPGIAHGRIHIMTSGTTGAPKIAAHSLSGLLTRVHAGCRQASGKVERWLLTYQPTGFAGLQVALTAAVREGVLILAEDRTMAGSYVAARQGHATHISGTPTFWRAFLMVADPAQLPLEQATLGGEAADQATLDRIHKAFPLARITHTYASTEAGVVYAVHDGREGFPAAWLDQPPSGLELRIVDGLLQVRTNGRMSGYVSGQDQPLREEGWLVTADRVEIAGDRVRILGREDKTINVGGNKVYPQPVEAVILQQPGVREARVYGQPNPLSGALVAADIVLAPGEEESAAKRAILVACRAQLAPYQVPRVLKFVDEIAVSAANKKA